MSADRIGRAVWFTAPRTAEVLDARVRAPGPDEVVVRAIASLVSLGSEMRIYRGQIPKDQPVRPSTVEGSFAFPIKYGYQCVGRVIEAGAGNRFHPGDLVFCRHPHQSEFTIGTNSVDPPLVTMLPEMNPMQAIFCNLADVSLNALLDVPIRIGDVVAVFGLGVVGTLCALLAKRTAARVIAVDPLPLRQAIARRLGVDAVAPAEALDAVMSASDGRGADVAIEASGAPAALQQAIRATGIEGTVTVVAFYGDTAVPLVLSPEFHVGRQRLVSSMTRAVAGEISARWDLPRRFSTVLGLLPDLQPERLLTQRFGIEHAADAYRLADSHPEDALAIALTY